MGAAPTLPTLPVQNDVLARAPAQVNEMCTWSVCGLAPVYFRHPRDALYEPQILRFQITYWMPSRRAIAYSLPYLSFFSSQVRNRAAFARPPTVLALTPQSKARPSLCSESPPTEQPRTMPRLRVVG